MNTKKFRLQADEFQPLATDRGGCFATDHITVDGMRVGYLYRVQPDEQWDSGWRFFSGLETDEYVNDPANLAIYDVNTIANYDKEIIPLLNAPYGTAFGRDKHSGIFAEEEFIPEE